MVSVLKKGMSGLFDKMRGQAKVIGINRWNPATMLEIEVQISSLDMEKWKTIHLVKCRVGDLECRGLYTQILECGKGNHCFIRLFSKSVGVSPFQF